MAKKSNKFLNFIGLGTAEEPNEEMYYEEETPVANRRDNYSGNRGYQREQQAAPKDYGYSSYDNGSYDNGGYDSSYDNSYDSSYSEDYREPQQQTASSYGTSSKIVNHPSVSARHRTMIYQLSNYEDSKDVIDDLLEGHSVLINLESLALEEAQRIIDTLIGACYAINATIKKAAAQTYLLAPETVEVSGTYADDPRSSTIFDEDRN